MQSLILFLHAVYKFLMKNADATSQGTVEFRETRQHQQLKEKKRITRKCYFHTGISFISIDNMNS